MTLPGGRPILVDGKSYHWICKRDRRDRHDPHTSVVTIASDEGGPVIQHQVKGSVTPSRVAQLIRKLYLILTSTKPAT